MARLIDLIRTGKVNFIPPYHIDSPESFYNWKSFLDAAVKDINRAQVIIIDNVAKYYYETQCHNWDLRNDFPNLVPPFDAYWMEYNPPNQILERDSDIPFDEKSPLIMRNARGLMGRTGALLLGRKIVSDTPKFFIKHNITDKERVQAKFELMVLSFSEDPDDHDVIAGAGITYFRLDEFGRVVAMAPCWYGGSHLPDDWYFSLQLQTIPMYLATSFLHCKNVKVENITPPEALSKKFQRQHGRPLVHYKTLQIDPMKRILEAASKSGGQSGLNQALHVCRGHFKDFRQGEGLGKHHTHGLWYWDSQIRGSHEDGIVLKDYKLRSA